MVLLWIILIGFLVGIVAKFLMPGDDPGGFVVTAGIGIAGSIVATYLGHYFGFYRPGEGAGFVGAVVGSILLLAAYRAATHRRGRTFG
jgi:uncharacterized membrane protein YeaQ/YmgE (transglycosylase-associated protein family)